MIEMIQTHEINFALIIRANHSQSGTTFFTDDDATMQIGSIGRLAGDTIQPHRHKVIQREISKTYEVLFVKHGRLEVKFYDDDWSEVANTILFAGDCILLLDGAHGFNFLEETQLIEVKQGPYLGLDDKVHYGVKS